MQYPAAGTRGFLFDNFGTLVFVSERASSWPRNSAWHLLGTVDVESADSTGIVFKSKTTHGGEVTARPARVIFLLNQAGN